MLNSENNHRIPDLKDQLTHFLGEFDELLQKSNRPADEVILSDYELMKKLGVCKRTTNTWRSKRIISFFKVGSLIFYRLSDVLSFLEKHEVKNIDLSKTQKLRSNGK